MTRTVYRRNNPCPLCYCKDYLPTYDGQGKIWECVNCCWKTRRHTRHRKTNKEKALEAWKRIRDQWEPYDRKLSELHKAKQITGGGVYVHSWVFNSALKDLLEPGKHITNTQLAVRTEIAEEDLQSCVEFIAKNSEFELI